MSKKDEETLFPKKWNKVIAQIPEFKDTADAASEEDLKKIIVSCEGNIYKIDQEKESDIKLNSAKEIVKDFSGPYKDALRFQMAKIKYALFLLECKGVDLDNK